MVWAQNSRAAHILFPQRFGAHKPGDPLKMPIFDPFQPALLLIEPPSAALLLDLLHQVSGQSETFLVGVHELHEQMHHNEGQEVLEVREHRGRLFCRPA